MDNRARGRDFLPSILFAVRLKWTLILLPHGLLLSLSIFVWCVCVCVCLYYYLCPASAFWTVFRFCVFFPFVSFRLISFRDYYCNTVLLRALVALRSSSLCRPDPHTLFARSLFFFSLFFFSILFYSVCLYFILNFIYSRILYSISLFFFARFFFRDVLYVYII